MDGKRVRELTAEAVGSVWSVGPTFLKSSLPLLTLLCSRDIDRDENWAMPAFTEPSRDWARPSTTLRHISQS